MKERPLLHVVHLILKTPQQIAHALRDVRLCRERAQLPAVTLFFCDLPDAQAVQLPGDADLIRCVQSGVMSMNARRPGAYLFLVRRRMRCNTLMMYLGEHQTPSVRETMHTLLNGIRVDRFEASNISPASFLSAFDAVLITHAALRMPPDLPARMADALHKSGKPALLGEIILPFRREEPVFARLLREGFSLLPPGVNRLESEPLAAIYDAAALGGSLPQTAAAGCSLLLDHPPVLSDLFFLAGISYTRAGSLRFLFPAAQLAALLVCALFGWQWPALAALILPELYSLFHPLKLPGALVRLCFLPRHALTAINALLCRRFAASSFLVQCAGSSGACVVFGMLLLFLAVRSVGALAALLPVSLLWLSAPMAERALSLPARERIPLNDAQQKTLRMMAADAFAALSPDAASPAHALAACAACMLSELEADEAARRVQGMLGCLVPGSAFDAACLLCAAQYFTDQMGRCDAALRALPSALESLARAYAPQEDEGFLGAFLRIALSNLPSPKGASQLAHASAKSPLDHLFFRAMPDLPALFPVTHPHAFLKHAAHDPDGKKKSVPLSETEKANRFLVLSCAALDAPFCPLFLRSAAIAPYTAVLDAAHDWGNDRGCRP